MPNLITVTSAADSGVGSLRAAIATAQNGDTIQFAASLTNQTIALRSEINLTKSIEIDGSNLNLTLSGNRTNRIFSAGNGVNISLKNLALINGKTNDKGGAIWLRDSGTAITVFNCRFENNEAGIGGAIQIGYGGKATVLNSQFNGNKGVSANNGFSAGAIANDGSGEMVIRDSQFTNNQGFNGGAIYSLLSPLTVENCLFLNNEAIGEGGGAIFTDGGNAAGPNGNTPGLIAVRGSRFEGNKAKGEGGALFLYGYQSDKIILEDSTVVNNSVAKGTQGFGNGVARGGGLRANSDLTIRNVTFANNTSAGQGGGIWLDGNLPTNIINSTFSGNRVTDDAGGAMFLNTGINAPVNIVNSTIVNNFANRASGALWLNNWAQPVTLTNSIVAFNTASGVYYEQQVGYQPQDGGGNIEYPAPNYPGRRVAANSQIVDPKLGALQEIDGVLIHPLLAGSPAINAGVTTNVTTDQRNVPRNTTDIGAFELSSSTPSSSSNQASYTRVDGSENNDVMVGTRDNNYLVGGNGKDIVMGGRYQDILVGGLGNDTLMGGVGGDRLSGGDGADRFIYSGIRPLAAMHHSMLNRMDRITDFDAAMGDRIKLDFDSKLSTVELPKGLFNAGDVTGQNLAEAANRANADKNFRGAGAQGLAAEESVFFRWNSRTFLMVNDRNQGFSRSDDLLIEMMGVNVTALTSSTGTLATSTFFV